MTPSIPCLANEGPKSPEECGSSPSRGTQYQSRKRMGSKGMKTVIRALRSLIHDDVPGRPEAREFAAITGKRYSRGEKRELIEFFATRRTEKVLAPGRHAA